MLVWPNKVGEVKNTSSSEEEQNGHSLTEDDLFVFLQARLNKLDAIVITGGEPTLHKDLPDFIARIKKLGYKIKLDTNGTNPEMLKKLIKADLVDYFAMDIKSSFDNYEKITGVKNDLSKIKESIIIIKESAKPYEFRTTLVPGLVEPEDIKKIAKVIKGADNWFLQQFKPDSELVNPEAKKIKPYSRAELNSIKKVASEFVKNVEIR